MKQFVISVLLLLLSSRFFAQTRLLDDSFTPLPVQEAHAASLVTLRNRAPLEEVLNEVFDNVTANSSVVGFNAAIRLPDGTYWKRATGIARQIPETEPLTTAHLIGMGSITKTFLAAAILRMQEEGLLDLDDSIGQYLPPYPNISGAATIRQLLGHRTGFYDYLNDNQAFVNDLFTFTDSIWNMDTLLQYQIGTPFFPVDSTFRYSNTNYLLAGKIIEVVTGQHWYEVLRQKVIDPMGLSHTFQNPFETHGNQPYADVFIDLNGNGQAEDLQGIGIADTALFTAAASAGSLITTPEDLASFSAQLYGGLFLQPASLEEMQSNYSVLESGDLAGLGTFSDQNELEIENWGHSGDILYKSIAWYFPTLELAIAIQQNDYLAHETGLDPSENDYGNLFLSLLHAYQEYQSMTPVSEVAAGEGITVSPNPVTHSFFLNAAHISNLAFPVSVEITDAYGRRVLSSVLEHAYDPISMENIPAGCYFLRVGGFSTMILKS